MKDSRLIHTLAAFSPIEWKHFREFVGSAYFNRSGRGTTLLEHLQGFRNNWSHQDLSKEQIFAAIFPKKTFHSQEMLDEMSHLFRLARIFLSNEALKAKPEQMELLALSQLRHKQVLSVQKSQLNSLTKKLSQSPYQDDRQLFLKHRWSEENNLYQDQKTGRRTEDSLEQKIEALDRWYFYLKLRDSCELLNRMNILKKEPEFPLLKEILLHLDKFPEKVNALPGLELYRKVFFMLSETDNTDHYLSLVASLEAHIAHLSVEQAKIFYTYAQNFCIRQMNRGNSFYSSELLRLYKTQLTNGLLTTGKTISHTTYTNIVSTALKFREFDWISEFMESHKSFLSANIRDAVYRHNLAACYFEQQKWREAIRLLRDIEHQDAFYEISAKVMLCKAYFEQGDWEALSYLMGAFARSLKRNKVISPSNRNHYLNFLKYLKRIATVRERSPSRTREETLSRYEKIQHTLAKAEDVSNLKWLKGTLYF